MGILWTIIIGFLAGVIAKFLMPGPNEPAGFILTTILGIVGAFVATFLGQAIGWYGPNQGAGFIGAIVGAVVVLVVWGYRMWWLRRPTRPDGSRGLAGPPGSRERPSPAAVALVGLAAVAAGLVLPVLGVSLILFLLVDALVAARRERQTGEPAG